MKIVADLHLHSKYSRAVSPQMTIFEMAKWARIKGIDLLGTGDFTHPEWLEEIKRDLEEKEGILEMREKGNQKEQEDKRETKFLLTTEISSIYTQGGEIRRVHNIIIAPSISVVEKINSELKKRGCNLSSDGRPIIGLSAKNLAELVFSVDNNCLVIPAHIWTPWFSMFGSNSGFESIEECFGEFSKYIYAVETGLSSDPKMNWQVADLDNRSIVSFSDAHSLEKLGRELTVFEIPDIKILRYEDIRRAINSDNQINPNFRRAGYSEFSGSRIAYTIEFYPEEGKYHYSGHRNCGIVWSPEETKRKGISCPVCGKPLTIGVAERVEKLGVRDRVRVREEIDEKGTRWIRGRMEGQGRKEKIPFIKLVPLMEIIAETYNVGSSAQKVKNEYEKLTEKLGSEIEILTRREIEEIGKIGGGRLAEGVLKVRKGDIFVSPGFDGVFGIVKIWEEEGDKRETGKRKQMELF